MLWESNMDRLLLTTAEDIILFEMYLTLNATTRLAFYVAEKHI
jgi:hypothetical protein